MTAWLEPKLNSSGLTKQVDDDSLVTMVIGLGSISFLLLDDDSLPVWDCQRLHVIQQVKTSITGARWQHEEPHLFFFFFLVEREVNQHNSRILTACPSSSVSASSGVEDEGESEPW